MAVQRIISTAKWLAAASLFPFGLFVYDRFSQEEHEAEFVFCVLLMAACITLLVWLMVWAARLPKAKEPPERISGDW